MNHKLSFFSIDNLSYKCINYPKLCVPKYIVPYIGITTVVGGTLGIIGSSLLFHKYYPPKTSFSSA